MVEFFFRKPLIKVDITRKGSVPHPPKEKKTTDTVRVIKPKSGK